MDIEISKTENGKTIRELLQSDFGFSRALIKKLKFKDGGILVNGSFVTVRHVLAAGEILSLAIEDEEDDTCPYMIPVDIPIEIIYRDKYIVAVNKPSGMPSHPSHGHRLDTVANSLAYLTDKKNFVFRPVNRLDRDTSGVMLTAEDRVSAYKMFTAMQNGEIKKRYIAVLDKIPEKRHGSICYNIKRSQDSIITREACGPDEGKTALTEYDVIVCSQYGAVVAANPVTGRTHQLRVHFSKIGCPIVGDDLYGACASDINRHALHCVYTSFPHPSNGNKLELYAPLPHDMAEIINSRFGDAAVSEIEKYVKKRELL